MSLTLRITGLSTLCWMAATMFALTTVGPAEAQPGDVCGDFDKTQRIQRLGVHPITKRPAADHAALAHAISEHEAELRAFLATKDLSHIADELIAALKNGEGVTERALVPGEVFEWMIFREKGAVTSGGPRCLDTKKDYAAFEVTIRSRKVPTDVPKPSCDFTATGNCDAKTLAVDAANASPDVTVTLAGDGRKETILSDGQKSWSGPYENRFRATYTFTAEASREVTGEETAYTFVIPKACVNLALTKVETRKIELDTLRCKETRKVEPCPAPPPACDLTLSEDKIKVGEQIEINATGHWDTESIPVGLEIEVSDGTNLGPELPAYYDATAPGLYTVKCIATNEAGKKVTSSAPFEVVPAAAWIVRAFGAGFRTSDEISSIRQRSADLQERSKLSSHSGEGFGISAEYLFNDRIGLEAALIDGEIDARYTLDLNDLWGMADDDYGLTTLTVGPNFHLTPEKRFDLYVGPFVGFASVDGGEFSTLGETFSPDVDDEFVFGAQLGLDLPFKADGPWALHLGLRYISVSAGDLDLDPIIGTAGVAYRF